MAFNYDDVKQAVASTVIEASTTFRPDQITKFTEAARSERNENAAWVLEKIIENASIGEERKLPLCDDTGIPQLFLELGEEAALPATFLNALKIGVEEGLKKLPGRPMAVKGNDIERIEQSAGLYQEPEKLFPAPLQLSSTAGKKVKLTVLMLGGGPEIRGRTMSVFHKHSLDVVLDQMIEWAIDGARRLGCLPCVPAFGLGRTNLEAAVLAVEAMKEGSLLAQDEMESYVTTEINKSGIGPLGLGGNTTALGTFIKVGPQRASGVRVVSMRLGCCFDPRRATYTWSSL